jgi:hypothetical protein
MKTLNQTISPVRRALRAAIRGFVLLLLSDQKHLGYARPCKIRATQMKQKHASTPCNLGDLPRILLWALALLCVLALASCIPNSGQSKRNELLITIEIESSRLAHLSMLATQGDVRAFQDLTLAIKSIDESMAALDLKAQAGARPWRRSPEWKVARDSVKTIVDARDVFLRDIESRATFTAYYPIALEQLMSLARRSTEAPNADAKRVYAIMQMALVLQRLPTLLSTSMAGADDATAATDSLARDMAFLGSALVALRNGDESLGISAESDPPTLKAYDDLTAGFQQQFTDLGRVLDDALTRFEAMDAVTEIEPASRSLALAAAMTRKMIQ